MKPCIVGIWKADPCKMPQGYEFGTWAKAICVLHDMPVVSPAEQFLQLTEENREKVRAYVAQLIDALGTTEGKMEGGEQDG